MASLFRWPLWSRRNPQWAAEAANPKPREELPVVDPTGYGTQVDPLAKSDRKDAATVVSAALRTPQEQGRAARYADFEAMDFGDIAGMLDAVVDAALTFEDVSTGRGFKVESDDPRVQELLNLAVTDADLQELAEEILRDGLKYGDAFGEPLFAGKQLVGVQTYTPAEMYRAQDDKGHLPRGKDDDGFFTAFQQRRNGQVVAGWQPWEMVHFKFKPSRKRIYSERGLLDDLRDAWKKLQLIEQGMVVARVTRAYPRRIHMVDMTNKDRAEQERTLMNYIARMTKRVFGQRQTDTNGLPVADVGEDLYVATGYTTGPDGKPVPKLNSVTTEDPAIAGLAELGDVTYMRQKLWSVVPSDTVGIQRNTTGDMDAQDVAYTRLLRRSQRQLEKFLRAILDQVLLANGRLPKKTPYRVIMPTVDIKASWKHADARFRASMTLRNYLEMGAISRRYALKQAYNLSDLEVDRIWAEIEDEATNPIFAPVLPARDGPPSVQGAVNKANNDVMPPPSRPKVVPATGATSSNRAVSKNGINRGTDLGQRLRGNMSGG